MNKRPCLLSVTSFGAVFLWSAVCQTAFADQESRVGAPLERRGDEIAACGRFFHSTTPVVLWTDPGGYDAYRVELRFAPWKESAWPFVVDDAKRTPNRYGIRRAGLAPELIEKVRGGGWDLPTLQKTVDQFVIHFDARGTSRKCFEVLHDLRGLSVHFMLDLDGTIYQTLDLKESAWHATIANGRSIGIEIANVGAYPVGRDEILRKWYQPDAEGHTRIVFPVPSEKAGIRDQKINLAPIREQPVQGTIQGRPLTMYDLTPQQYESLARLTATLCTVFPKIKCDYPRDGAGRLLLKKLPDAELAKYQGLLGHYHVQTNKVDPGPAFQWDRLIETARNLMKQ
jgi:hypothetical protein